MRVASGAILSFEKPKDGRVLLMSVGKDKPMLYDSEVDSGEIYAPAGSFVFLAGSPGDVFEVRAR